MRTRFLIILAALFVCASLGNAQSRTRPKSNPTVSNAAAISLAAQKVSIQIKNVSKFTFLLGGIAQGIEDIDRDAKAGKVSRSVIDKNTENKRKVIAGVQNIRVAIAGLESEFRASQTLKKFTAIQGVTEICFLAEDQANAGQLMDSGRTLLIAIEKLADTLATMR